MSNDSERGSIALKIIGYLTGPMRDLYIEMIHGVMLEAEKPGHFVALVEADQFPAWCNQALVVYAAAERAPDEDVATALAAHIELEDEGVVTAHLEYDWKDADSCSATGEVSVRGSFEGGAVRAVSDFDDVLNAEFSTRAMGFTPETINGKKVDMEAAIPEFPHLGMVAAACAYFVTHEDENAQKFALTGVME
jgi:hypothetical protein